VTKAPPTWLKALVPILSSVGGLTMLAGGEGVGFVDKKEDGTEESWTSPTIGLGVAFLAAAGLVGQHVVTKAEASMPGGKGATSQYLLALVMQQATVEGDEETVKAITPLVKRGKKKRRQDFDDPDPKPEEPEGGGK
jgi:drug/metabolite transporter (DMT)-like permease